MRTKPLLVLLVALVALTVFVTTAAAAPGRGARWSTTTTPAAKPVPAGALVAKTVAMLGGSAYPWVQPMWQTVDGIVVVTVPRTIATASTQPPAWVLSR